MGASTVAGAAGTGAAGPAGPLVTAARFTSLILTPSLSSSNSTKLLASMSSISSLISLSKRPPLTRHLRRSAAAAGAPAPMGAILRVDHIPMLPQIEESLRGRRPRSGHGALELHAGLPDHIAGAPGDAARRQHHAEVVVAADRAEDREAGAAGDRDLFQAIGGGGVQHR